MMPGPGRKPKKKGRARKGTGAIWEYKPGRFRGLLDLGIGPDGKRKRVSVTGASVEEVQEKLNAMKRDWLLGLPVGEKQQTVSEYLIRWLEDAARPSIRPTTYQRYATLVRNYISPRIGTVELGKLSPVHVQALYADLERDGVSPRMRQFIHAVLHRAMEQAVKWQLIARNPCAAVERPRVPRKEFRVLDADEARRLLEAAKGDRLEALLVLALTTGMRQGELLGLQWEDVDLKNGTIYVRRTLLEVDGRLTTGETKSGRNRRLDLPEIAVEALREHRKRMMAEGHPGPWVFCDTKAARSERTTSSAAGLSRCWGRPVCRRFASMTSGTPPPPCFSPWASIPRVVQERLGHSQISVTLDTYSHVLPSLQKQAASRLDALFRSAQ